MAEQQDQPTKPHGDTWKQFAKKQKAREERRKIRDQLRKGDDPQDSYGLYKGWRW